MTKAKSTSNHRARKTHNSICQTGYDEQQYSKTKNLFFRRLKFKERRKNIRWDSHNRSISVPDSLKSKIRCRKHLFHFPRTSAFLYLDWKEVFMMFNQSWQWNSRKTLLVIKVWLRNGTRRLEKKILRLYKSKLRLIHISEIGQRNEVVGSLKQNSGLCETRFFYCSIIKCYAAEREMNLKWK